MLVREALPKFSESEASSFRTEYFSSCLSTLIIYVGPKHSHLFLNGVPLIATTVPVETQVNISHSSVCVCLGAANSLGDGVSGARNLIHQTSWHVPTDLWPNLGDPVSTAAVINYVNGLEWWRCRGHRLRSPPPPPCLTTCAEWCAQELFCLYQDYGIPALHCGHAACLHVQ